MLTIQNGLTMDHSAINLGNNAPYLANYAMLSFYNTQTLGGTGKVVFGTSTSNVLVASGVLTLGSGITVRGSSGVLSGTIVNAGTVTADTANGTLRIEPAG